MINVKLYFCFEFLKARFYEHMICVCDLSVLITTVRAIFVTVPPKNYLCRINKQRKVEKLHKLYERLKFHKCMFACLNYIVDKQLTL